MNTLMQMEMTLLARMPLSFVIMLHTIGSTLQMSLQALNLSTSDFSGPGTSITTHQLPAAMALPHLHRTTSSPPCTSTMACRAVDAITNFTPRMPTCTQVTMTMQIPCSLHALHVNCDQQMHRWRKCPGRDEDVDRKLGEAALGVPGLLLHHAHAVEGVLLSEALVDDAQLWDLTLGEP
jgi:hypothetical protein